MHRNEYVAKVGFVKTLDRTCQQCGGIYASNERSNCPKCGQPLVIPSHQTENGIRQYCFTEVTIYPLLQSDVKEAHKKRLAAANGLETVYRIVLWGKYDQTTNTLQPDARVRYLVPKRTIRVLLNTPPLPKLFQGNDKSTKLELKYTFDARRGDQFQFLDSKQEATTHMEATTPTTPAQEVVTVVQDDVVKNLASQLAILTQQFAELTKPVNNKPAPVPSEESLNYDPSDDCVDEMEMDFEDVIPF